MTDKPKTLREEIAAKHLNSLPIYRNKPREAEYSTATTKETTSQTKTVTDSAPLYPNDKLLHKKMQIEQTKPFTLTDTQYALVCSLFHELNEEFYRLSPTVQLAYYERLYKK